MTEASRRRSAKGSRGRRSPPRAGAPASSTARTSENGYTNDYFENVVPLEDHEGTSESVDQDAEEVACRTAVDAAPWLLGDKPKESVPPEKFFEQLKPFKELVAEDIGDREDGG